MMTFRKIKLREYTLNNKITLKELKEALIEYYYNNRIDEESLKVYMERELIITPIINAYGQSWTTLFSINGSPPKGECVLIHTRGEEFIGTLIFIGNRKESKPIMNIEIVITKDEL